MDLLPQCLIKTRQAVVVAAKQALPDPDMLASMLQLNKISLWTSSKGMTDLHLFQWMVQIHLQFGESIVSPWTEGCLNAYWKTKHRPLYRNRWIYPYEWVFSMDGFSRDPMTQMLYRTWHHWYDFLYGSESSVRLEEHRLASERIYPFLEGELCQLYPSTFTGAESLRLPPLRLYFLHLLQTMIHGFIDPYAGIYLERLRKDLTLVFGAMVATHGYPGYVFLEVTVHWLNVVLCQAGFADKKLRSERIHATHSAFQMGIGSGLTVLHLRTHPGQEKDLLHKARQSDPIFFLTTFLKIRALFGHA